MATMRVEVSVDITSGPVSKPAMRAMVDAMRAALLRQGRDVTPPDSSDEESWTFEVEVPVDEW